MLIEDTQNNDNSQNAVADNYNNDDYSELLELHKESLNDDADNDDRDDDDSDDAESDNADAKKKDKDLEKEQKATEQTSEVPKSWSKDKHELFKSLPPEAQATIIKRDQDMERGIQQIYQRIKPQEEFVKQYQEVLTPYQAELEKIGDPTGINTIQTFLEPARILNFGSPQQKADMLLSVAQEHGVDLFGYINAIINQNGGQVPTFSQPANLKQYPEFQALNNQINELTTFKKNILNEQNAAVEAQVVSEIEGIIGDTDNYPYFNQLIPEMQNLLQSGFAEDLKDAYEKAVALSPATREQYIAQQADKKLAEQQQAMQQKNQQKLTNVKNNMMSPKNNKGSHYNNDDDDDDFDDDDEDAFDERQKQKLRNLKF